MTDQNPDLSPFSPRHPELVSGSIFPHARSKRVKAQAHRKVTPFGVFGIDEIDLPISVPVFELFFARNGEVHRAERFEMNEAVDFIAAGETFGGSLSVLPDALGQIGCDANVECAHMLAGEDVDAGFSGELHTPHIAAAWMLKQVQHDELVK